MRVIWSVTKNDAEQLHFAAHEALLFNHVLMKDNKYYDFRPPLEAEGWSRGTKPKLVLGRERIVFMGKSAIEVVHGLSLYAQYKKDYLFTADNQIVVSFGPYERQGAPAVKGSTSKVGTYLNMLMKHVEIQKKIHARPDVSSRQRSGANAPARVEMPDAKVPRMDMAGHQVWLTKASNDELAHKGYYVSITAYGSHVMFGPQERPWDKEDGDVVEETKIADEMSMSEMSSWMIARGAIWWTPPTKK